MIVADKTDHDDDVRKNEVVAFRCRCSNADDDLFDIVHDEGCPLADEDCQIGRTDPEDIAAVTIVPEEPSV